MKLTQPKTLKFEYECLNSSDINQVILDISEYIKKGYALVSAKSEFQTEYSYSNIYTITTELIYVGE